MKNSVPAGIILAALLSGGASAAPEMTRDNMTNEQAEGIADLVSRPAREIIRPAVLKAVFDAMQWSNAASWALWDLANGLAVQQKAGKKPEPDAGLVETNIRLRMRCNTGDLCLKRGAPCKVYPRGADFDGAAQAAFKELKSYAAGLKGRSPLAREQRMRMEGLLETARKRVLFPLPQSGDMDTRPSPATPGEEDYLRFALENKKGDKFTPPPWP